jgi:hypothetical protein
MSAEPRKPNRLETSREHYRVVMADRSYEVWTRPFDYSNQVRTSLRHDWPKREDDPFGYLLFLTWSASRHANEIPMDMKYEAYAELVDDIEQLAPEGVGPTKPAPGAG